MHSVYQVIFPNSFGCALRFRSASAPPEPLRHVHVAYSEGFVRRGVAQNTKPKLIRMNPLTTLLSRTIQNVRKHISISYDFPPFVTVYSKSTGGEYAYEEVFDLKTDLIALKISLN